MSAASGDAIAPTVGSFRRELAMRLQARWGSADVEKTAALDAKLLLAHAIGIDAEQLILHEGDIVSETAKDAASAMVERRLRGEPVARIVGEKEFWSLPFRVSPHTLIPRPDTETLIITAMEALADRRDEPLRFVDFGTGSGCILLAALSEFPNASGLGTDRDPEAIAVAADNARRLGLAERSRFAAGNWTEGIEGPFDVIFANPPYVEDEALPDLAIEVIGFEPRLALSGGMDGLDGYRAIIPEFPRLLAPSGIAIVEFGPRQAKAIAEMAAAIGMTAEIKRDLAGRERAALLTISAES